MIDSGGPAPPSPPLAFGAAVRALRQHRGLSLNELARRAAIDPAYVHRIEAPAGGVVPRRPIVLGLASALGLDRLQRDDLLVRAGYTPETVVELGGWDRSLADIAGLLVDPAIDSQAKAELREIIALLSRRWR